MQNLFTSFVGDARLSVLSHGVRLLETRKTGDEYWSTTPRRLSHEAEKSTVDDKRLIPSLGVCLFLPLALFPLSASLAIRSNTTTRT